MEISQNITPFYEEAVEYKQSLEKLRTQFNLKPDEYAIIIDVSEQKLYLIKDEKIVKMYPVSTSKYGIGNEEGSYKTPLGTHRISKKIGSGAKIGTIFKSLTKTNKTAEIYVDGRDIAEDIITTRIMWLEGLEPGINKGKGIDSHARHIYIHGTPEEGLIGKPASHGCIRMRNKDVIELFELVREGTLVEIQK